MSRHHAGLPGQSTAAAIMMGCETRSGCGSRSRSRHHKQHSRPRAYALRGVLHCGLCGRRMSAQINNDQVYYRCRFPAEYALANRVDHPKTVYVKEADVLGHVDDWLAELFATEAIDATVTRLAEQAGQLEDPAQPGPKRPTRASPTTTPS